MQFDSWPERLTNALFCAKIEAQARGQPFTRKQVADILQTTLAALIGELAPAAKSKPKKSEPGLFGDPKSIPPTPEQVTAYSASIGYAMDGKKWCDFYEAKGWVAGKVKMKD